MKEILVSICLPVYNGGLYIEETIWSLINQSHKNIEIIISDNASIDNTKAIIEKLSLNDNRIKYYRNDRNIGYCANIFSAVKKAQSEIVAIYHADDIYEPTIVEEELKLLLSDNNIGGVFVKLINYYGPHHVRTPNIYNKLFSESIYDLSNKAFIGDKKKIVPLILKYGNFFACPSFMTRKKVFLDAGGYNDRYPSNEDLELWIKILKNGYKLAIVDKFLLKYRCSKEQASSYWNSLPELAVMYKVIDEMLIQDKQISELDLFNYRKNKSIGFMIAGYNAFFKKNYKKMYLNFSLSRNEYTYPLFCKLGLVQRLPMCGCFYKKIKFYI